MGQIRNAYRILVETKIYREETAWKNFAYWDINK
jgi:hypothetical protein